MSKQSTLEINQHYINIVAGTAIVSTAPIIVKLSTTSPLTDAFYRMLFGTLTLLIIALIKKDKLQCEPKALIWAILAGLFFCGDLAFWHYGIRYIGPGLSTILVNSQVFILALFDIVFFNNKPGRNMILSCILALVGFYFLVFSNWEYLSERYLIGVCSSLIAALSYAFYICCLRIGARLDKRLSDVGNLLIVCISSCLFLSLSYYYQQDVFNIPSTWDWGLLLIYGVVIQTFGWLLIVSGIPKARLSIVGFILVLQPVLSFLWEILFFSWHKPMYQYLGSGFILAALFVAMKRKKNKLT